MGTPARAVAPSPLSSPASGSGYGLGSGSPGNGQTGSDEMRVSSELAVAAESHAGDILADLSALQREVDALRGKVGQS